jgi:hypothetical protein
MLALALAFSLATGLLMPAMRAQAASPSTVYLPNVTKMLGGPDGWQTPFIVQNVGGAPTDLTVSFYGFADGALVTQRHVAALAPGTSYADVPNNDADLPAAGQFAVVVQSSAAPIVSVVNEHQGTGNRAEALSYVGLSSGALKVSLPYVAKADDGWLTTFIIQNLGGVPATVTVALDAYIGDTRSPVMLTRRVEPGRSAFVDPRQEPGIPAGSSAATITADQPIAVVANVHNDGPAVAFPRAYSYNGVSATGTATYLPYAAKNADGKFRSTKLFVQNAGTAAATPELELRRGGKVVDTFTSHSPIAPGERNSLDLARLSASTPVTDGEYGVVVTGGQFAVLAQTTTQTTATGYTGSATPAARLYLPNVTRTLGGPAGWTTPIVLQSAGATVATLRWYRFSDGGLVKTQALPLVTGDSVKIDPRAVDGLADGTQYSVVVEASGGTIAGVVFEYADGGDNAMAYEAFPAAGDTKTGSFDPKAYFKPLNGYTYMALPADSVLEFHQRFNAEWGKQFVDMDARGVAQGGTFIGAQVVFALSPDFAENASFRQDFLATFQAAPGARTTNTLGTTVVFVGPSQSTYAVWLQGNYVALLYGRDQQAMSAFIAALIAANQ